MKSKLWLILNYSINLILAPFLLCLFIAGFIILALYRLNPDYRIAAQDTSAYTDARRIVMVYLHDVFVSPLFVGYRIVDYTHVNFYSEDKFIVEKLLDDNNLYWREHKYRNIIGLLIEKGK